MHVRRHAIILPYQSSQAVQMVPQHNTPDEPTHVFSPEVERALMGAFRALATGEADSSSGHVREAVAAAGSEARERALRPEQLVIAFKRIEKTMAGALDSRQQSNHMAARSRVMQLLLEAYYGDR
jgi:hypothetical protein